MAKKKATKKGANKKGKEPTIRPCEKCGRTDFDNDYARRGHQGKCDGSGKAPARKRSRGVKSVTTGRRRAASKYDDAPVDDPQEPSRGKKRTRSQIGRGSKRKGNSFENDIKKFLATWYGEDPKVVGSKTSLFQRAPGSGGTSPVNWPLDLHVPSDFPWAVECKNREIKSGGFEAMERFFTVDDYAIVKWFREAEEELAAAAIQKPLLLVFTRNLFPNFVAFRRPVTAKGENLLIPARHMTLCNNPFGEIIVALLDEVLTTSITKEWWLGVYAQTSPGSWMPRKWKR